MQAAQSTCLSDVLAINKQKIVYFEEKKIRYINTNLFQLFPYKTHEYSLNSMFPETHFTAIYVT